MTESEATSDGALPVPTADPVATDLDEPTKEVAIPDSKSVASPPKDGATQTAVPMGKEEPAVARPLVDIHKCPLFVPAIRGDNDRRHYF